MTDATIAPAEPDGAARLPVLDVLRGLAILGILFMNINDMGGSIYDSFGGDPRVFGWTIADQVAWWLREVLANGTARCLLEMLFGVGMVILTDRAATRLSRKEVLRGYAFRNLVLFAFGMVHVLILLWPGDILHTYGLAALVAVLFRRLPPRWLLTIGLVLASLQLVGVTVGTAFSLHQRSSEAALLTKQTSGQKLTAPERKQLDAITKSKVARAKQRADMRALATEENRQRSSGIAREWVAAAWGSFWYMESRFLEIAFVWEAAGTMLIGAALYKLGIIQGARSRRYYAGLTVITYAFGLGCRAWAAWATTRFDHSPSFFQAPGEFARIATTLGHIGLVNLLLLSLVGARAVKPFEAAGRTALSIYIAQTLICLWVLYPPWGLALYGHQGWAAMMATALAVNAALLIGANWWVRRYRIAPVEWAWRSIVAGQRLPFRRTAA